MEFEKETLYNGFKLIEKEYLKEIGSAALVFEHQKSGARLLKLENEDSNKLFSIAFRTPPSDHTGVAHILEHSVLCGSRKFNTKEPFVELIKGSLNTFLNAMTFPDKTMYPVGSKNEKDFFNLMDVYLDATLYPNIHNTDLILKQEGWHYEIEDKNDPLNIKGVVYNEMKGAFSSPVRLLYSEMEKNLFPDNTYSYESGGDPEFIPELTQEDFKKFHNNYYHPSNSYIFLYGNGNTEEELKFIDQKYLKDFDKIDPDSAIDEQKPFEKPVSSEIKYSISESEDDKGKTFHSISYGIGKCTDPEIYHALEILEYILLSSPAAPVKQALISKKLGEDVIGIMDNGILQPMLGVILKNSDLDKKQEFLDTVENTLKELVKNGIDKDLVEAAINRHEFKMREAEFGYPKGLVYNMISLNSWLYDSSPYSLLKFEGVIADIRKKAESGYFERFIKENILNNNHISILTAIPEKGLNSKKGKELAEKLDKFKKSLKEEQLNKLIEDTKRLKKRQTSVDSKEALESIPLLKIEDISKEVEKFDLNEKDLDDVKVYSHNTVTNGINYVLNYFNTTAVSQENIPYIELLSGLLGKIDTKKRSYGELSNLINIKTGGVYFQTHTVNHKDDSDKYCPNMLVRAKSLYKNTEDLMNILAEILTQTDFSNKERILDVLREIKSRTEMRMMTEGHVYASKRAFSYISQSGAYEETLSGISFYKFLVKTIEKAENDFDSVKQELENVYRNIFDKNNLFITTVNDGSIDMDNNIKCMIHELPAITNNNKAYKFDIVKKNEALLTPSQVQYVIKAGDFKKAGYNYDGTMKVMKTIVQMDYLWNKVRVLGGAYGAFVSIRNNGNYYLGSYRDPEVGKTIDSYNALPDYLKGFETDDREMRKYIIGTVSVLDPHRNPERRGMFAIDNKLSGLTWEELQHERDQVLNTTSEDIRVFAEMFQKTLEENYICVFGNEEKLKNEKDLFIDLVNVM